ncbi:MAG: hypothetical protein NUW01_18910, partial [Gemmatimonadaceae bacterium]|nr:hypothetical protein [Gemmatimonadaceae bacterium]
PIDCEHSMDACLAWLWPALQARGYYSFRWQALRKAMAIWHKDSTKDVEENGPTPAAAFCEAFLAAMGEEK